MSVLDEFSAAGVPITWRTVLLGWDGPGTYPPMLSLEDVQKHAADCLAGSDSRDEVIAIAAADSDASEQVRAELVALVKQERSDVGKELRKWQLVLLIRLLDHLPEDPLYGLLALTEFWGRFDFPSDGPHVTQRPGETEYFSEENYERLVERHRGWLERELKKVAAAVVH